MAAGVDDRGWGYDGLRRGEPSDARSRCVWRKTYGAPRCANATRRPTNRRRLDTRGTPRGMNDKRLATVAKRDSKTWMRIIADRR